MEAIFTSGNRLGIEKISGNYLSEGKFCGYS